MSVTTVQVATCATCGELGTYDDAEMAASVAAAHDGASPGCESTVSAHQFDDGLDDQMHEV